LLAASSDAAQDAGGRVFEHLGDGGRHAVALYETGIRDGDPRRAMSEHAGRRYTQHSTGVPDGAEGFIAFFDDFLARNPRRTIEVVRAIEDGSMVFLHVYQDLGDGVRWVTTDFFDTDEAGKVVEHWDVIVPFAPHTPSGHTSIDGATAVEDLDLTAHNKALVRELIEQVLMPGGDPHRVDEFIDDVYVQHNAEVPDGLGPFRELAVAPDKPLVYHEIVHVVGQGNFVATLCRTSWAGEPLAQADLFRIEGGKVVEHWDAAAPVAEDPVNSGTF
jgi:predicted SnoaL-like aldol condensation-catalyzing enzyme